MWLGAWPPPSSWWDLMGTSSTPTGRGLFHHHGGTHGYKFNTNRQRPPPSSWWDLMVTSSTPTGRHPPSSWWDLMVTSSTPKVQQVFQIKPTYCQLNFLTLKYFNIENIFCLMQEASRDRDACAPLPGYPPEVPRGQALHLAVQHMVIRNRAGQYDVIQRFFCPVFGARAH